MQFKTLIECLDYFKEESVCREYLIQQRWNGQPTCPFCSCTKVYSIEAGKRFKCGNKECNKKFSVTVGTVFENSKIPLRTWFAAIYLFTSGKKGISSLQLHRQLGITQKTAWFVLHRVREMLRAKAPHMLKTVVQVDETYVGGKEGNKHAINRLSVKEANEAKTPIIGLIETGGKVIPVVTPWVTRKAAENLIEKYVDNDAFMVTDAYGIYSRVGKTRTHIIVNHSKGIYVNGDGYHTNGIENFWSLLKRGIYGIYHQVSAKHLQRYCDEFAGRVNTRQIKDSERFQLTVRTSEGRLTYKN